MIEPGRKFVQGLKKYRFSFNGKENDNEVKGEGNQQDYGMRIYDPRLGKFLSVDPITNEYPELTPYQFASNRPIYGIDRDGLEFEPYWASWVPSKQIELRKRISAEEYDRLDKQGRDFVLGGFMIATGIGGAVRYGGTWLLTTMFRSGVVGASVNVAISYAKGDNGYETLKSGVSGFFSGVVLGGYGKFNSLGALITAGATSAATGEFVNQTFDNTFGKGDGTYNLEKIMLSGGIELLQIFYLQSLLIL